MNEYSNEAAWYVAHTYSGYENKVKLDIEKTTLNRNMQDQILEVRVPMQKVSENKNGEEKISDKKLFPGYVLIHMFLNEQTWYIVRNTRGVTGFVGPGSEPIPLTVEEMYNLGLLGEEVVPKIDIEVGDTVVVKSGAWKDTISKVVSINEIKKTVTIKVDLFGGETELDLNFSEIKKL